MEHDDPMPQISMKILKAFADLLNVESSSDFVYETEALAGCGENSYGAVMKVKIETTTTTKATLECVLKIAPRSAARRAVMRVADYYRREVFMYAQVFAAYRRLCESQKVATPLDILPAMLAHSLEDCDEFLIFEDLSAQGFAPSSRRDLPTFEMVEAALQSLATFHALSLALQTKQPQTFAQFVAQLQPDNLFTPDILAVSVAFGKSYLRRAQNLLRAERKTLASAENSKASAHFAKQLRVLGDVEAQFKEIGLCCVDGAASAPFAVICHGDFWINNLMNKFEPTSKGVLATKLVDFQMSRYASPVLDLVHYLFICLAHEMREKHFHHFLNESYYKTLAAQLQSFNLESDVIYPRAVLHEQLKSHGAYGLCMAAFSLPFFVADQVDLLDLDEVTKQIKDICEDEEDSNQRLVDDYDLLTPKTVPIFKRRMVGIVDSVIEHEINTKF